MGLFDAFGVGGGKLALMLQTVSAQGGGTITGTAAFTGGKRAQNITAITVKLTASEVTVTQTPNGPQNSTASRDVVPAQTVSGPFSSQPGQTASFPFSIQVPAGLRATQHGQVSYRVNASADIDGEVDPGASAEVSITATPGTAAMPAAMPGAVAGGKTGAAPAGFQAAMAPAGMMPGAAVAGGFAPQQAPLGMGSAVMAQWQDGNWYAGKIVAASNGMFGVDWDNPQLGASTWVQPAQVMAAQPAAPVVATQLGVGSRCVAQWQDGNWYPGKIVAVSNGMFGVDWDNPQLGASTWVQPAQVLAG